MYVRVSADCVDIDELHAAAADVASCRRLALIGGIKSTLGHIMSSIFIMKILHMVH